MFVYSIYDKKGCFHVNQFFASNNAEAVRTFARLANDSRSDVNMFCDEFALYSLGQFNPDNGVITPFAPLKFICDAESLIKQPSKSGD